MRLRPDHGDGQAAYQLAVLYRDGHGFPANPSLALEFFQKAATVGYVPAMAPLSYAYGTSDSPVRQQRATFWAQKAAEAGDPKGWLILGYEYNQGWLGGDWTYGYRMAMDAYKKAADGGDCLAMMNIGGLYFNGDGATQNKTQAQTWFGKAESCEGKNLDWVREKAAKYRERAAAGHLPTPAAVTVPARGGSGLSGGQMLIAGFAALVVVAAAIDLSTPSSTGMDPAGDMKTISGRPTVVQQIIIPGPTFDPTMGAGIMGQPCLRGTSGCY